MNKNKSLMEIIVQDMREKGYDLSCMRYFDHQATTPCDEMVLEAMKPFQIGEFGLYGNPHARSHAYGWAAERAMEYARMQIARSIGLNVDKDADVKECIIFTSGATESNNLAIKGLAEFWKSKKRHIISTRIEHKCVLEALASLERTGFEVTYLDVDACGFVSIADIEKAIRADTLLMTISAVNHEIGTIQDIEAIGKVCRKHNVFLHVDAAQAWGKIEVDVEKWNIDLMSLSAHKTYGPKGIGALYVRCAPKRVRLQALFNGGGQERGMRSGTTPVPLCVGMGKAAEMFCTDKRYLEGEYCRMVEMHQYFVKGLMELTHIYINGPEIGFDSERCDVVSERGGVEVNDGKMNGLDDAKRIPHNINISILGVEGESLMIEMREFAFSSGSACTSANLEPSYVLRGIGVKEELLHSSVRISFGRQTSKSDVERLLKCMKEAVVKLREISPVWDCIVEGRGVDSWNIDQ